jgi:hypothetical protein
VAHVRIAANRISGGLFRDCSRKQKEMEALRDKYPPAQLLHLLRVGRLKVPPETTAREVYALLRDAAFLQVCSACTMALNTGEKKRDADVPLFCACVVSDADMFSPEHWPMPSWRHQGCVHGGKVRVKAYKYEKLPVSEQWCFACRLVRA